MKCFFRHGGPWLLLFFSWLPSARAQTAFPKISDITITNVGPAAASEALVRANIHVKPGDNYIRSGVDKDVLNLYATGFFKNIQVAANPSTNGGVILTYILEGKPRLNGINFQGNLKYTNARLLKKVTSKVGERVDERKLFEDTQAIQEMYEKSGYPRTTVTYRETDVEPALGTEGVTFQIVEGSKIKIAKVDFIGAGAFSQKELRKEVKTKRHRFFSWFGHSGIYKQDVFEDDLERLAEFYRNAGYIDFELKGTNVTILPDKTMLVEFTIFEGAQYKVGAVTFKGNKLFTNEQIEAGLKRQHDYSRSKAKIGPHNLEADIGMTFKPDALTHDIHALEDFYGSKGYIDVKQGVGPGGGLLVHRIPNTETGTMDIEYIIDEGQRSTIEKIEIRGNVKTKDKVIRRELSVSPGDVFDMVQVRLSKQRIEGLDYFEKVDTRVDHDPTLEPTRKDLIIGVDEKSTGQFNFGAGFSTVESISGFVEVLQSDFDLFNPPYFTGAGQKFLLHLQVGTLLQDYRVSFVEPWFLDRHLVLSTDLYRRVSDFNSADNLYDEARTGARVSLTRALFGMENFRGSLGYGIEDIDINHLSTNAPNEIIANGGNTLVSRFTGSLAYDTRNSVQLPSKGQETSLSSTLTVGSRDYVVTELKSGWYFRGLGKRDVLEIQGRAGVAQKLSSREIPFYDRFYLGGQDTLRGFDFRGVGPRAVTQDGFSYEPIGGDSYWMGSVEYSIPVLPSNDNVRFALFYDIGNVSQDPFSNSGFTVLGKSQVAGLPPPVVLFNPLAPVGNTGSYSDNYGFGIHINIPHLGPLRLDYGIPVHHDRFNSSSGKLQFGVGFSRPL